MIIEEQRFQNPNDHSPPKIKRHIMKPDHRRDARVKLVIKDEIRRFEEEREELDEMDELDFINNEDVEKNINDNLSNSTKVKAKEQ
ncbi:hypothetical protein HK099_004114 [Clydaea vesicula]|uniref:Uncharacterized protein n=1 Tax=Clydaea vesicula TaxID=447962 RepID=A0AAD5U0N5_9FUNG|nr:hypothetical protein HK099_004114 [Clydaea vesicula]KAJ3392991.1 hypothetical protein HDU92_008070 [Lobulomyces angularis]